MFLDQSAHHHNNIQTTRYFQGCLIIIKIFLLNPEIHILKAKSNFTLLLYIPFLGIGEWYFKCV